jgi:hypothetical protein
MYLEIDGYLLGSLGGVDVHVIADLCRAIHLPLGNEQHDDCCMR